jgi:hypothetical protein
MKKNNKISLWLTFIAISAATFPVYGSDQSYGHDVSGATSIRIADLTANPEQYVDQLVKIEGLVDDVCPMKGCWVDIIEAQSSDTIRFKVQDDVIVFPVAAKGSQIVAEGFLRKHDLTKQQAIKRMRHFAKEKGEEFNEDSVTGAMVFYQIEGVGAVVQDES